MLDEDTRDDEFRNIFFNEMDQEKIFRHFRKIAENTGAYYMSYLYEDFANQVRFAFTTNPDWSKTYVGDHLIDDCHMWLHVTKEFLSTDRNKYIFLWDTIKPETSKQRSIFFERTDHEVGVNGVSFCTKFNQTQEILGIAPDLKTPEFQRYISQNMNLIRSVIYDVREKIVSATIDNYNDEERLIKETK